MWILYLLPAVPFVIAAIVMLIDLKSGGKEEDTTYIHYAERIINNKFITSCGQEIGLDQRNVANFIPKVTCPKCLEKIK
jgi:hypothetical protein